MVIIKQQYTKINGVLGSEHENKYLSMGSQKVAGEKWGKNRKTQRGRKIKVNVMLGPHLLRLNLEAVQVLFASSDAVVCSRVGAKSQNRMTWHMNDWDRNQNTHSSVKTTVT